MIHRRSMSNFLSIANAVLLAGVLASGVFVLPARSQSSAGSANSPAPTSTSAPASVVPPQAYFNRNHPNPTSRRAAMYYKGVWGVDSLQVRTTESGELIRFTYHVVDPEKAKPLNDKANEPSLIDPQAGVSLVVPQMEKVGLLRQTTDPEAGKSYWMAFSNPGRPVKRGDRVIVVIGRFRAEGLVVE